MSYVIHTGLNTFAAIIDIPSETVCADANAPVRAQNPRVDRGRSCMDSEIIESTKHKPIKTKSTLLRHTIYDSMKNSKPGRGVFTGADLRTDPPPWLFEYKMICINHYIVLLH